MNISQILKERRLALNISQTKLATHCGFAHKSNISRLEAGQLEWKWRDAVRASKLLRIEIQVKNN